jgi:regulator of replication initiation timing
MKFYTQDDIPDAVDLLDEELKELREQTRDLIRVGKRLRKEIDQIKVKRNHLTREREMKFPTGCKHPGKTHEDLTYLYSGSGIGYAGHYCSVCGTLIVVEEERKKVGFDQFIPEKPFKKGCKHKWKRQKDFKAPVLNIYGKWCQICGRITVDHKDY